MPTWCPCVAPHAALVGSSILAPSHSRPLGTMPTIGSGFESKKMGKCGWGRWSELYLVRRAPTKIVYGWLSPPLPVRCAQHPIFFFSLSFGLGDHRGGSRVPLRHCGQERWSICSSKHGPCARGYIPLIRRLWVGTSHGYCTNATDTQLQTWTSPSTTPGLRA